MVSWCFFGQSEYFPNRFECAIKFEQNRVETFVIHHLGGKCTRCNSIFSVPERAYRMYNVILSIVHPFSNGVEMQCLPIINHYISRHPCFGNDADDAALLYDE